MNGIEWIVEAHDCSAAALSDPALMQELFETLICDLNLRPVAPTQWHEFPNTSGITGLCLLCESHIACHTFPEFGSLCLNVFCCVPRPEWQFAENLKRMLGAKSVSVRRVLRPYSAEDGCTEPVSDLVVGFAEESRG